MVELVQIRNSKCSRDEVMENYLNTKTQGLQENVGMN